MKVASLCLLLTLLSFSSGYWLGVNKKVEVINYKELISPKDIEIPKEGGDAKLYYEKAFTLFLATLGLKLQDRKREELSLLLDKPKEYIENESISDSGASPDKPLNSKELSGEGNELSAAIPKREAQEEYNLENLPEKLGEQALARLLKDPDLFFVRTKFIKKFQKIKRYNGEYRGTLFRIAGENKGRNDEVLLSLKYSRANDKESTDNIEGSFSLQLFNGTELYSNSSGDGGNGNFRFKGRQLVIEAGPGVFLHFSNNKLTEANYYEDGVLRGVVRLRKI